VKSDHKLVQALKFQKKQIKKGAVHVLEIKIASVHRLILGTFTLGTEWGVFMWLGATVATACLLRHSRAGVREPC